MARGLRTAAIAGAAAALSVLGHTGHACAATSKTLPRPAPVSHAHAGLVSSNFIAVDWTRPKSRNDFDGVDVRRAVVTDGRVGKSALVDIGKSSARSFNDHHVAPGTTYEYSIRSRGEHGILSSAKVTRVSTPSPSTTNVVSSLSGYVKSTTKAELDWNLRPNAKVTGIEVRYSISPRAPSNPAAGFYFGYYPGGATAAPIYYLLDGKTYSFSVFALFGSHYISLPNSVTLTMPTGSGGSVHRISGLAAPIVGDTVVKLTWALKEYNVPVVVRRAKGLIGPARPTDGTDVSTEPSSDSEKYPTPQSAIDSTASPGTTYTYSVFELNPQNKPANVLTITVTTVSVATTPCTDTWTGAAGTSDWTTAGNWSAAVVPGDDDDVCIPAGTTGLPVVVTDAVAVDRLSNSGGLSIDGGDLSLGGRSQAASTSTGPLGVTGEGALDIASDLELLGPHATGTIDSGYLEGSGSLTVSRQSTATVSGHVVDEGHIVSAGRLVTSSDGELAMSSNSALESSGILDMSRGGQIVGTACSYTLSLLAVVQVSGTVTMGSGANLGQYPYPVYGYCLATVDTAKLTVLQGTAMIGDHFDARRPAALEIPSGATLSAGGTLGPGVSVQSQGNLAAQDLNVAGPVTLPELEIDGAIGSFGSGGVTVTSSLSGRGLIDGGSVTVAPSAVADASFTLGGGSLINEGDMTIENLVVDGGSLTNHGTLDIPNGSQGIIGYEGAFDSTGTVTIENTGPTYLGGSPGATGGYGSNMNGALSGSVMDTGGGTLIMGGNPFEVTATGSITTTVSTTLESEGLELDKGSVLTGPQTLDDEGGFASASDTSWPTVDISGPLSGSGDLTVTRTLTTERGGIIEGPGSLDLPEGANAQLNGLAVANATVDNAGAIDVVANMSLDDGAVLDNTGIVNVQGAVNIDDDCANGVSHAEISNSGTFAVDASEGGTAEIGQLSGASTPAQECLSFDNHGALSVTAGSANFAGDPLTAEPGSTVSIDSGSALISSGNATIESGASMNDLGTLDDTGSLVIDENLSLSNFALDGDISGSGDVSVTDSFSAGANAVSPVIATRREGGRVQLAGTITLPAPATGTISGLDIDSGSLVNAGRLNVALVTDGEIPEGIQIASGASLRNSGTLDITGDSGIYGECPLQGQAAVPQQFISTGTMNFDDVDFAVGLTRQGDPEGGCLTSTLDGPISVNSGFMYVGGGSTLGPAASITGSTEAVMQVYGSLEVQAGASISDVQIRNPGSITFDASQSLPPINSDGRLTLAPSVVLSTSNLYLGGSIELEATHDNSFGEIVTPAAIDASQASLQLSSASSAPDCGVTVTALSGGSVTSGFGSVSGPTTSGQTWQPEATSTSAGGVLSCP